MLPNSQNPLLKQSAEEPAEKPAVAPANTEPETDDAAADETVSTDEPAADDPPKPAPLPEGNPAPAETATAAAPKLSAFERGKLRMLGMGDLIARVEKAEGETAMARGELARLTSENATLRADLAKTTAESSQKIEIATQAAENKLSKSVTAELASLGVTPEAAPSQISANEADKTLTRAEFEKLDHPARNEFFRAGGKLI